MRPTIFVSLCTLLICTFTSSAYAVIKLEYDSQRSGGDYTHFYTPDAQRCANKCQKSPSCQAFDYHLSDQSCWLKSHSYPAKPQIGVVSGKKKIEKLPVSTPPPGAVAEWKFSYDVQRPGGDYTRFQARNEQECSQHCSRDARCMSFDYTTVDYYCYLKSWIPRPRPYQGIISGVRYYPEVRRVQEALIRLRYNPGTADGLMGKNTQSALKRYQNDSYLPVTGRIDEATLIALGLRQSTPPSPLSTAAPIASTTENSSGQQRNVEVQTTATNAAVEPIPASEEKVVSQGLPQDNFSLSVETIGVTYLQLKDSIHAEVLTTIPAGTVLNVLAEKNAWYLVYYQGQEGYVLTESVKKK